LYDWKLLAVEVELLDLLLEYYKQRKPAEDAADVASVCFESALAFPPWLMRMTISLARRKAMGHPGMRPVARASPLPVTMSPMV
jgi:hypothetical protein